MFNSLFDQLARKKLYQCIHYYTRNNSVSQPPPPPQLPKIYYLHRLIMLQEAIT